MNNYFKHLEHFTSIFFLIIFCFRMLHQFLTEKTYSKLDIKIIQKNKEIIKRICKFYRCYTIPKEYEKSILSIMLIHYNIVQIFTLILIFFLWMIVRDNRFLDLILIALLGFIFPLFNILNTTKFPKKELGIFYLSSILTLILCYFTLQIKNNWTKLIIIIFLLEIILYLTKKTKDYFYFLTVFTKKDLDILLPKQKHYKYPLHKRKR